MPVHEEVTYSADCDECDWADTGFSDEDSATWALDEHIRKKH